MLPTSLFPPGACLPTESGQPNQTQAQLQASSTSLVAPVGQLSQHRQQQPAHQHLQLQQQPSSSQLCQQTLQPSNTEVLM